MKIILVLFKKNGSQKIFPLPSNVTTIGRRHSCDLQIPLTHVSKRHCQLSHNKGVLRVRDLGSRNGTYLNGNRIDEEVVRPGDYIGVGPVTFAMQIDGQPETIAQPARTKGNLPKQDARPTDVAEEQFDSFTELDEFDPLDGLESLEELG
jgi:pSer/pThr/pTyr-binding forkhead associated (FHA) protein